MDAACLPVPTCPSSFSRFLRMHTRFILFAFPPPARPHVAFLFCRAQHVDGEKLRHTVVPSYLRHAVPNLAVLSLSLHLFCIVSSAQESRALRHSGSPPSARTRRSIDREYSIGIGEVTASLRVEFRGLNNQLRNDKMKS